MRIGAAANKVVEEKVVQFVRSYGLFRLLDDLSVAWRQQLGTDGSIENILQYVAHLLVLLCRPRHQVAYQRFGNADIDRVHRHMIAVVGAPPQGRFAQIARSDDDTAPFVGQIHQDLGALPGLGVFIDDVMLFGVVADILKVDLTRLRDIDLLQAHPKPPA